MVDRLDADKVGDTMSMDRIDEFFSCMEKLAT